MIIQRVTECTVHVDGVIKGSIGTGLLIFLGVAKGDSEEDLEWLCNKVIKMRVFPDAAQVMNEDIVQANGDILLVSQFTLYASTRKGNRPSYTASAPPEEANALYLRAKQRLSELLRKRVQSGEFGANMQVELVNDGPVTILLDSTRKE